MTTILPPLTFKPLLDYNNFSCFITDNTIRVSWYISDIFACSDESLDYRFTTNNKKIELTTSVLDIKILDHVLRANNIKPDLLSTKFIPFFKITIDETMNDPGFTTIETISERGELCFFTLRLVSFKETVDFVDALVLEGDYKCP